MDRKLIGELVIAALVVAGFHQFAEHSAAIMGVFPNEVFALFLVMAALLLYALLLKGLGFIVSTFLLLLFLFKGLEPQKWRIALILAAASCCSRGPGGRPATLSITPLIWWLPSSGSP